MRILIQRVSRATLSIDGREYSHIDGGLLVFAGVEAADGDDDIAWLAGKLLRLRIFDDADGVMNLDVTQAGGQIMIVSQFTLFASTPLYPVGARGGVAAHIRTLRGERAHLVRRQGRHGGVRRRHEGGACERRPRDDMDRLAQPRVSVPNRPSEIW